MLMNKGKINISMDKDLIEFAREYAGRQRTSVSEIFTQFMLNLKRSHENDPTEIIMADPDFRETVMGTIERVRKGDIDWYKYKEVF
jgi:hypothetical protein